MDISKLQYLFKFFDLVEDTPVKKLKLGTVKHFHECQKFLNKFAKFLSLYQGKEKAIVMGKDLAEISGESENSHERIILDFKRSFQEFRSALPENIDINYCVLEIFSNCLLYIINLIHSEPDLVTEIYEYYMDVSDCIFIYSEAPIILDPKNFKNTVSFFIADLMKILTGFEISLERTNSSQVCNLIKRILTDLAKNVNYRHIILRQILKRIKYALSYSKVNNNFDGYVASPIFVFEYFLSIIHDCCNMGMESNLDYKLLFEMKKVLEEVKNYVEKKIPFMILKLLENILVVL